MKIARVFPAFSIAFAILYAIGISVNNTFLFFYPKIGEWHWGRIPRGTPGVGIPSQWYGWTSEAIVGALVVAAIALAIPDGTRLRAWAGWALVIPFLTWLVAIDVIIHLYWLAKPG